MYESLNNDRIAKIGCNLVIQLGMRLFVAHREVLLARSDYFRDKINPDMRKEELSTIRLQPEVISPEGFEDILQYIYISKIDFRSNFEDIYRTAKFLNIEKLVKDAESYMLSDIRSSGDNIVLFMNIATEFQLEQIQQACKGSLISNPLSPLGRTHLIPALSYQHLRILLKRMHNKPEDKYYLIIDWIQCDPNHRGRHLPDLLQNILVGLSSEFLFDVVAKNPLVCSSNQCLLMLVDIFGPRLKSQAELSSLEPPVRPPRGKPVKPALAIKAEPEVPKLLRTFSLRVQRTISNALQAIRE